ncbi:MAG: transglycosylase SLT domain-containing protein [Rickettsiales bacterium]
MLKNKTKKILAKVLAISQRGRDFDFVIIASLLFLSLSAFKGQPLVHDIEKEFAEIVVQEGKNDTTSREDSKKPFIVSSSEGKLYKKIFSKQDKGNWNEADELITELSNDVLLGDVLAERYLHDDYNSSKAELDLWIKNYPDNYYAKRIANLIKRKYPDRAGDLPKIKESRHLKGYGDANSTNVRFANKEIARLWKNAINEWKNNKKSKSAVTFKKIANITEKNKDKKNKKLSKWQYSAVNFWAYRSNIVAGNKQEADVFLRRAASNSRNFYGILANKKLGRKLDLNREPIYGVKVNVKDLLANPEVMRIIALAKSDLNERAEKQIRALFFNVSNEERWGLLSLAKYLKLPSAQIAMAKYMERDNRKLDLLKYPIPKWQPENGFNINPYLVYALMHQESGFRVSAESPAGAMGLMQLMPKTASKMYYSNSTSTNGKKNFKDPIVNITLGERYIERLLETKIVDNNLIYMLASYNAGIGNLKKWKEKTDYNDDPLLFIENIPYWETRYYVMKVMTNYWIYSELSEQNDSTITALLNNQWPKYLPSELYIAKSEQTANNG